MLLFTEGDPVGAVCQTLESAKAPVASMLAWALGQPDCQVVWSNYPDATMSGMQDLDQPQEVLGKWLKDTSLQQVVRATTLLVYDQN